MNDNTQNMTENVQVYFKDWKTILGTRKRGAIIGVKDRLRGQFQLIKKSLILENLKQKISNIQT